MPRGGEKEHRTTAAVGHCCQIAEDSAILLKSSGKYVFVEEIDSGTAIKFS